MNSSEKKTLAKIIVECEKTKLDFETLEKSFKELYDKHEPLPLWKETPVLIGIGVLLFSAGYKIGR